jgi:hypothetical protein
MARSSGYGRTRPSCRRTGLSSTTTPAGSGTRSAPGRSRAAATSSAVGPGRSGASGIIWIPPRRATPSPVSRYTWLSAGTMAWPRGPQCRVMASRLASVPVGTKSAASLPRARAMARSSSSTSPPRE